MAAAPIDLSAGFVPKPQSQNASDDIDLSAGLVPNSQSAQPTSSAAPPAAPVGIVQTMRNNLARNTAPVQPNGGFFHDYVVRPLVDTANRAGQDVASPMLDFVDGLNDTPEQTQAKGEAAFKNSVLGRAMNDKNPNPSTAGSIADALQFVGDAVTPFGIPAGSRAREFVQDARQSPLKAATNAAGDVLAAGMTGAVAHGAATIPGLAKETIRGPINEPIAGGNLTPAARYASAKRLGVNLDAADATNSPLFGAVKRINSNSLFGGPTYDVAKATNTVALTGSTDTFLNKLYPEDRESGGVVIQNALKQNHALLKNTAQQGFDDLTGATGNSPVPGAADLGMTAKRISAEQEPYYAQFPSLRPSRTMSVLDNVSSLAPQDPTTTKLIPQPPATWSTMHRLGSDLHGIYANNPDIVQTRANGWLQQLVGQNGDAIRDASAGLSPTQRSIFDSANSAWGDMKGTYDNPSSPLYHAVRTETPSTLYGGIGTKTPEMAKQLADRLGPAIQPMRRGVVENALKTTNDGSPNFRTFGTQLNRIPADYRAELFSPDQNRGLYDIANTSNALSQEFNPSGSGHQVQKIGEAASMFQAPVTALSGHPILAAAPVVYNAGQYGAAKLMNSPSFVDRLMSPTVRPSPFAAPTGTNPFTPPIAARATMFGAPAASLYGNNKADQKDDKKVSLYTPSTKKWTPAR